MLPFSKPDFLGCSARLFDPRGVRGQRDTDGADLFFFNGIDDVPRFLVGFFTGFEWDSHDFFLDPLNITDFSVGLSEVEEFSPMSRCSQLPRSRWDSTSAASFRGSTSVDDLGVALGDPTYTQPGKRTKNDGKSPCLMGKSTISMAIFNSYVMLCNKLPEGKSRVFIGVYKAMFTSDPYLVASPVW